MGSSLIRKYMYFDIDFVDAEDLLGQLSDAIKEIKKTHKEHDISDRTIKIGIEPGGKTINMMYYDLADSTI